MSSVKKILLVEDSRTQAELIMYLLREEGYEVELANNGKEALAIVDRVIPDMILTDVMMPEMNGYELCRELKSGRHKEIPTLLLTTLSEAEDILIGLECQADSYLMKPVDEKLLLNKISDFLSREKEADQVAEKKEYRFYLNGTLYNLNASRQKILEMLVTINKVTNFNNQKLSEAQEELDVLNMNLEKRVEESTADLKEKILIKQQLESDLVIREKRYKELISNANVGIFLCDTGGQITFVNSALTKMLEYRSGKYLIGSNISSFFESDALFSEISKNLEEGKNLFNFEIKLFTAKKMPRWVLINLVQLDDVISGMIIDRTEKKFMEEREQHYKDKLRIARERAEESDRKKSLFLSGVSYQIKEPLNAVTGYARVLAEIPNDGSEAEDVRRMIAVNSLYLRTKVQNILDLARIEAGKVKLELAPFELNGYLTKLIQEHRLRLGLQSDKNLSLIFEAPSKKTTKIVADQFRTSQIVDNLIDNAVRFSDNGEIKLGYSIDGQEVVFFVADQGRGIPPEHTDKIFERFSQLSTEASDQTTGLGLTVCSRLVELMGGRIWFESAPGKGTKFYFSIPYMKDVREREVADAERFAEGMAKFSNATILIAEDHYDNYILVSAYLEHTGARIIWAKNGIEAIAKFDAIKNIDIVLMDLKMPEKGGIQAISAIRKVNKEVPIIAVTAYSSAEDRKKAEEAGATAYLTKPVDQELLISNMMKYL